MYYPSGATHHLPLSWGGVFDAVAYPVPTNFPKNHLRNS